MSPPCASILAAARHTWAPPRRCGKKRKGPMVGMAVQWEEHQKYMGMLGFFLASEHIRTCSNIVRNYWNHIPVTLE